MSRIIRVLLIPVDGPVRFEDVPAGLAPMQKLVEGDIEAIGYREGGTAYGHDEGKFVHEPNLLGHLFLVANFNHNDSDPIYGPIVVLGLDGEGDDISIPEDLTAAAAEMFGL